jgi:hypothetical protein
MDLDLAAIDPLWLAIAAGVLLLVIVAIVVAVVRRRRRRSRLEERYGPEYRRAVDEAGSRRAADRELQEREERRQHFELRPLAHDERDRFRARWEDLQASFVDGPNDAVRRADELLDDVASKVGYPKADREQRLADLSVDHPATVDEYRKGRPTSSDPERGPTTEQLRQALLSSRSLFEALVGRDTEDAGIPPAPFRELEDATRGDDAAARSDDPARGDDAARSEDVTGGQTDAGTEGHEPPHNNGHHPTSGAETRELDLRDRAPASSRPEHTAGGSSPVLGPDGRPLPSDDR